jgi:hypothetical protein
MWHFDESAAQFPPQRAEEPESLRREIVEELRDHLTCARRREQMAGAEQTEEAVRRRVLERFGDPAAVARKLWLDWMWERIMTQRLLVAACALLAVISCVALGLAWASLKGQEDLIATWRQESETQKRDQQKLFEKLIAESKRTDTPSEWNPVEFRFVAGKPGGTPVAGVSVRMALAGESAGVPSSKGVSDEKGVVRFDRVRYGRYMVSLENSAKERAWTEYTVRVGEGLTETIVCPDPPAETVRLTPRLVLPEDLEKQALWLRFHQADLYRSVGDLHWTSSVPLFSERRLSQYVPPEQPLVAPDGGFVGAAWFPDGRIPPGRSQSRRGQGRTEPGRSIVGRLERGQYHFRLGGREQIAQWPEGITWPGNDYVIGFAEVLLSDTGISTVDALSKELVVTDPAQRRSQGPLFHTIALDASEWSYRVEAGMAEKPGTLWVTPSTEGLQQIRKGLAEIEKSRAEEEQRKARQSAALKRQRDRQSQ